MESHHHLRHVLSALHGYANLSAPLRCFHFYPVPTRRYLLFRAPSSALKLDSSSPSWALSSTGPVLNIRQRLLRFSSPNSLAMRMTRSWLYSSYAQICCKEDLGLPQGERSGLISRGRGSWHLTDSGPAKRSMIKINERPLRFDNERFWNNDTRVKWRATTGPQSRSSLVNYECTVLRN